MNKILLVGNGFDLAHGLLTKYEHFLYIMKNWSIFYNSYDRYNQGYKREVADTIARFVSDLAVMDKQNIEKLGKIIETNSWVHYYCNCEAEIDGWIDFEKEIYPVLELFEFIFQSDYSYKSNSSIGNVYIDALNLCSRLKSVSKLWKTYVVHDETRIWIKEEFTSNQYGILKKKIKKSLKEEFDEFIYAFEIYLHEFVYRRKDLKLLRQIKEINADYVISLNYTLTERLYGIIEQNTHHIHGSMREELMHYKNNMVLGVNEQENQNLDFIYFIKYFQRIQKRTGTAYTSYINLCLNGVMEEYELHIYGHSLDITDKDVLLYTMENACKIYIYYYDQEDFEHKVINLINLFGREKTEENIQSKHFDFIETNDEIIVE